MSAFQGAVGGDLDRVERDPGRPRLAEHAAGDLLTKRIIVGFGFWIFLLSDIVMFSAFFATFMGFALIWHIWWIVALAAVGAYATFVVFAWRDRVEYIIPADTVARVDRINRSARAEALAHPGTAS